MAKTRINSLWRDRKRTFLGLPWSFTKYELTQDRLFIETGFFNSVLNEVRLYRIMDTQLRRSFGQKMIGVGTIKVHSSDKSMGDFEIKNVKHPTDVAEMLSNQVEQQRDLHRVANREIIDDAHGIDIDDIDDDQIH